MTTQKQIKCILQKFHKIALETNNREKLTEELENILSESIVLPPVEIDNKDLFTIESIRKVTTDRRPQLDSIPDYRKCCESSIKVYHKI